MDGTELADFRKIMQAIKAAKNAKLKNELCGLTTRLKLPKKTNSFITVRSACPTFDKSRRLTEQF